MATAITSVPQIALGQDRARGNGKFATNLRRMIERMFDPYRPERHYMRGPGPKWHAKHGAKSLHS